MACGSLPSLRPRNGEQSAVDEIEGGGERGIDVVERPSFLAVFVVFALRKATQFQQLECPRQTVVDFDGIDQGGLVVAGLVDTFSSPCSPRRNDSLEGADSGAQGSGPPVAVAPL